MKNLLIITFVILLMGPLHSATAQEKQSDATLEETIDFIIKYQNYITDEDEKITFISPDAISKCIMRKYSSNEFAPDTYLIFESKFPLRYLYKVEGGDDYIQLYTSGNQVKYWHFKTNEVDRKKNMNYVWLNVPDNEMRPRLLKAFQHLAYLATEYREANREASGDAF